MKLVLIATLLAAVDSMRRLPRAAAAGAARTVEARYDAGLLDVRVRGAVRCRAPPPSSYRGSRRRTRPGPAPDGGAPRTEETRHGEHCGGERDAQAQEVGEKVDGQRGGERGQLAEEGVTPGGQHQRGGTARGDVAAHEDQVVQRQRIGLGRHHPRAGALVHRQGLAGHRGLVDAQAGGREQAAVGRHHVAGGQAQRVAVDGAALKAFDADIGRQAHIAAAVVGAHAHARAALVAAHVGADRVEERRQRLHRAAPRPAGRQTWRPHWRRARSGPARADRVSLTPPLRPRAMTVS